MYDIKEYLNSVKKVNIFKYDMKKPCVFLDRDGTLCEDKVYLSDAEGLVVFPDVPEGIRSLKEAGFHLILVTNQSGIGRGFFKEETLQAIHDRLKEMLKENGAGIDAIYYCPHHPEEHCDCRKPRTGLVTKALKDFDIDLSKSFIIGDTDADVELGNRVGVKTILLLRPSNPTNERIRRGEIPSDFSTDNFQKAVEWILKQEKQ
jgi:histidinol-phosphate phosphatase family protein